MYEECFLPMTSYAKGDLTRYFDKNKSFSLDVI